MITNHLGKSPLSTPCAFKSECNIFISPDTPNSNVTIKLKDGAGNHLGIIYKGTETKITGIFVKENQTIETEIDGGGSVFVSLLEENTALKAGVHFSTIHHVGDAKTTTFPLPFKATDLGLVKVFVEGQQTRDFTLSNDKSSVEFREAPFLNAEIDIFLTLPQS